LEANTENKKYFLHLIGNFTQVADKRLTEVPFEQFLRQNSAPAYF